MDELKPCPFCGSDDVTVNTDRVTVGHGDSDTEYYIHCYGCGINAAKVIPYGMTEKTATEAWNRRIRS